MIKVIFFKYSKTERHEKLCRTRKYLYNFQNILYIIHVHPKFLCWDCWACVSCHGTYFLQSIHLQRDHSACRKQPTDCWYGCDLCPELGLLRKYDYADQGWSYGIRKTWEWVKLDMKDIHVVLSCTMLYLKGAWRFNLFPFGFALICPYRNLATLVDKILQLDTWKNVSATTRTFLLKACTGKALPAE